MKHEIVCMTCGQLIGKRQKWFWTEGRRIERCCEQCMVDKYPDLSETFERKTKNRRKRL